MIISKFSPIIFSDTECPGLFAFVDSQRYILTPSWPILEIFQRSAGLSIAGVKSILKSPEKTKSPLGVWTEAHIASGIEWFTLKNSIVKTQSLNTSISGSTNLYFNCFWSLSSRFLLIIPIVNGEV